MPKLNRIYSFIAVGFVLIFLGKINKVGLYTAYFKTIADVEIRNTQGLELTALTLEVMAQHEALASELPSGNGPSFLASRPIELFPVPTLTLSLSLVTDGFTPDAARFLKACPVRGPTHS